MRPEAQISRTTTFFKADSFRNIGDGSDPSSPRGRIRAAITALAFQSPRRVKTAAVEGWPPSRYVTFAARSRSRDLTGFRSLEASREDESGIEPSAERLETAMLSGYVICPPPWHFRSGDCDIGTGLGENPFRVEKRGALHCSLRNLLLCAAETSAQASRMLRTLFSRSSPRAEHASTSSSAARAPDILPG